jgi:hypothetical protein
MFNYEMDLCSYFTCLHVLELLLFIAAIITYGICLSYMLVLFGIRIFNLFKYEGNMSLISLNLQQYVALKRTCIIDGFGLKVKTTSLRWVWFKSKNNIITTKPNRPKTLPPL